MAKGLTYKSAGVDIEAGGEFTRAIQGLMRRTFGPRVLELPDGFAGLFALSGGVLTKRYTRPVLAACTDGVGTKLKIAFMMDKHDTVGIDLVAMSVNDLVTVGAEPLFFLDYIATGKLSSRNLVQIIKGISAGCMQASCALLGGETAEMPDFYAPGEYDLAGFATGVAERHRLISGSRIKPKDVLIGIASSGLHSNGYSLARKLFFGRRKMSVNDRVEECACTLGEELLRPTRIYVKAIRAVINHYKVKHIVHGIAHITGGGLPGNIARILPESCQARVRKGSWTIPPIFDLIAKLGKIEEAEMYRVFNMGIGMVVVVPPYNANVVMRILKRNGQTSCVIGEVKKGKHGVVM